MAKLKITVDGDVLMDSDPGEWRTTPPDLSALPIRAGAQPAPWMLTIMDAVNKTAMRAVAGHETGSAEITVTTRAYGWTVDYDAAAS